MKAPLALLGAAVLGAALLGHPARADDTVLEVLTVKNRPAEGLLAELGPLVAPEGSLTASGNKLIVRATPARLAEVRRVLLALDVAPRSVWITVRQGGTGREAARRAEVTGQIEAPGGRTRTVVTGAFAQSQQAGSDLTEQRLRAVEGLPAFIRVARSEAVAVAGVVATPQGPAVAAGTGFQEAETGLYVLARLAGDLVTVEVAATKEAFNRRGGVDGQRLLTTASGRLGEWMVLGGLSRRETEGGTALAGSERRERSEERLLRILVEEVR